MYTNKVMLQIAEHIVGLNSSMEDVNSVLDIGSVNVAECSCTCSM